MIKLSAKTLTSKIAKQEIRAMFPEAKIFMKRHVPAVGYVLYVKNIAGKTIAQVTAQNGELSVYAK